MLGRLIRAHERRHATRDSRRRAHPFAWGLEYLDPAARPSGPSPFDTLVAHARGVLEDPTRFYADPGPPPEVEVVRGRGERRVEFPSALRAPEPETGRVRLRLFEPAGGPAGARGRAAVVVPQWNAEPGSHVALCRILARRGIAAARLALPYHEARRPAAEPRGDFAVSANLGRTLFAVRQAVADVRRTRAWLEGEGYDRVAVVGTSLGSCVSFLALAHDARIRVAVLHHVSSHFGDVVWRGLATAHVRGALEGNVTRVALRRVWAPISPIHFVDRVSPGTRSLLLIGRWDQSFPLDLSLLLDRAYRRRDLPHRTILMPWGHYTSAIFPFSWAVGWWGVRFLERRL